MATRLEQIKRRCEAATEGPWRMFDAYGHHTSRKYVYVIRFGNEDGESVILSGKGDLRGRRVDWEFLAHARTDLPWAVEMLERWKAGIEDAIDDLELTPYSMVARRLDALLREMEGTDATDEG